MRPIFAAAIIGGSTILAAARLSAQQTYEFSTVVELQDGIAAGDAMLTDDRSISFTLMAPGLDLDWVEIRDRERGGTVLATTRSRNGRPPLLEIVGMGEVLNDPGGGSVGVGFEDYLVEFTLRAPRGGLGRSMEEGVVVVGFTDGQSVAFPVLSGDPAGDVADGAAITMVPGEDAEEVFGDGPGPPEVVQATVGGRSGTAIARTDAPAPSDPTVARPPTPPAPLAAAQRPPGPIRAPQPPGPGAAPGPGSAQGPGAGPGSQGPAAGDVAGSDWLASATALRGRTGERFVFRCPPGGSAGRGPFGSEVYADHSSVCTAAVHVGVVTFASGGSVTIEIRAGQDFYSGSAGQGGVTSSSAGSWPGSFAVIR